MHLPHIKQEMKRNVFSDATSAVMFMYVVFNTTVKRVRAPKQSYCTSQTLPRVSRKWAWDFEARSGYSDGPTCIRSQWNRRARDSAASRPRYRAAGASSCMLCSPGSYSDSTGACNIAHDQCGFNESVWIIRFDKSCNLFYEILRQPHHVQMTQTNKLHVLCCATLLFFSCQ